MNQLVDNILSDLKIDQSQWSRTRFGEVAIQQKQSVDRAQTELTKYVKGEHMGSQDLHLREWGELTDEYLGPAFIRKFDKGDILYGSRRTYLRKVVIAPFSGITSNTTFVIKANEKRIDSRLLPFIMMSEGFTENSVKNSKGSVNPYINWKDIANYEFLLPPKEEQAQLAELLWAMDEVIEKEVHVTNRLLITYEILVDSMFSQRSKLLNYKPLSQVANINVRSLKGSHDPDYEFRYLDIAGITEPKIIGSLEVLKFKDAPSRARRITADNSIIISMVRPYHKSFAFLERSENVIASTGTSVIEVKKDHNSKYIFHQFFSKKFMKYCEDKMTGTNYPAITSKDLEQYEIALPVSLKDENEEAERLDRFDHAMHLSKAKIESSKALQKSLINQIF